jgi:hypothetical protein
MNAAIVGGTDRLFVDIVAAGDPLGWIGSIPRGFGRSPHGRLVIVRLDLGRRQTSPPGGRFGRCPNVDHGRRRRRAVVVVMVAAAASGAPNAATSVGIAIR